MSIWGRVIGGAAGFALGGPIGAILGVMAGGAFDKRSKSRSSFNFNRILFKYINTWFAYDLVQIVQWISYA